MGDPRQRVQHPELKDSEQHHDLKNDPGKKGDPDHMKEKSEKDAQDDQDKD